MREIRTPEECIIDKGLYLALLNLISQENHDDIIGDKLKCMKLGFLASYPLFEKRVKAFNLAYFNYDHGPISKHLYKVWNDLEGAEYISFINKNWVRINEHGLASAFIEDVLKKNENASIYGQIIATTKNYGGLSTDKIQKLIHEMEVLDLDSGEIVKINDAPECVDFIRVLDDNEACSIINIDQSWIETLALELNPKNRELIATAVSDFDAGRILQK